jgi:hypothetical protein
LLRCPKAGHLAMTVSSSRRRQHGNLDCRFGEPLPFIALDCRPDRHHTGSGTPQDRRRSDRSKGYHGLTTLASSDVGLHRLTGARISTRVSLEMWLQSHRAIALTLYHRSRPVSTFLVWRLLMFTRLIWAKIFWSSSPASAALRSLCSGKRDRMIRMAR